MGDVQWDIEDDAAYFSDDSPSSTESSSQSDKLSVVTLNVGGKVFCTRLATLIDTPETYFSHRFSGRFKTEPEAGDQHFIDRDPDLFRHVLNYLRTRKLYLPLGEDHRHLYEAILEEARFFAIHTLETAVQALLDKYCNDIESPTRPKSEGYNRDRKSVSPLMHIMSTQRRGLRRFSSPVTPIQGPEGERNPVPLPLVFDDLDF